MCVFLSPDFTILIHIYNLNIHKWLGSRVEAVWMQLVPNLIVSGVDTEECSSRVN